MLLRSPLKLKLLASLLPLALLLQLCECRPAELVQGDDGLHMAADVLPSFSLPRRLLLAAQGTPEMAARADANSSLVTAVGAPLIFRGNDKASDSARRLLLKKGGHHKVGGHHKKGAGHHAKGVGHHAAQKAKQRATAGAASGPGAAWLQVHNTARAAVGVAHLQWDASVAQTAQQWANSLASNGCGLQHGDLAGLGQNLAWVSGGGLSPQDATGLWVAERQLYSRAVFPGGCNSPSGWEACGHYTQIVWRGTMHVGCGVATCPGGATVAVCDYSPPGNYEGEYPY